MDGPEGARISIACAIAALETFGSANVAVSALSRAVSCDGDLEEFAQLFSYAASLAAVGAGGSALVASLVDLAAQKFGGAGATVLDLGARLATALGDQRSEARLLVAAAKKEPENLNLVRRAEASARALGDPELLEAVLDAIPLGDRAQALLAIADAADAAHDPEQAILALGRARAIEGLTAVVRRAIFDRLCDVLRRTGRRDDLELALEAELGDDALDPETRARLTAELAALIGARGDPEGALQLLRRVLLDHPGDSAILSDTVALLGQMGDKTRQAEALGELADATHEPAERLVLLRQVASLLDELGDASGALTRWQQALALDPDDLTALAAVERVLEDSGDYEALIELLAQRASLTEGVDDMRRIRLRRASLLEQRLGRIDEARSELEALTADAGDNLSVLRVLADLHERRGAPLRAAPLWLRASAIAQDRVEAADLSRRACESYLAGGDVDSARRVLEGMGAWAQSPKLLELAVEVERRRGSPQALAEALDELATASTAPAEQRAGWLVEGARAWLAGGRADLALSLATRAARIAPDSATAQLLARELEYRAQGCGEAADARVTVAELRRIRPPLTPEQGELCTFLVAEALDVAAGSGSGEAELESASYDLGERPLIALGLAERRAERTPGDALRLFDIALGGDLHGLRTRGHVALCAAEVAFRLDNADRARGYLAIAMSEPETRERARLESLRHRPVRPEATTLLSAELSESTVLTERGLGASTDSPSAAEESPPEFLSSTLLSSGSMREAAMSASVAAELGSAPAGQRHSPPLAALDESIGEPISGPPPSPVYDKPTPHSLANARPAVSGRYSVAPPAVEEIAPAPRAQSIRPQPVHSVRQPQTTQQAPATDESTQQVPPTVVSAYQPPSPRLHDTQRQGGYLPAASSGEAALFQALNEGSLEAGVELVKELENRTSRTQDLVMVCRRVALLAPGDAWAVGKLHEAALADRNSTYARAVEHVLGHSHAGPRAHRTAGFG